MSIRADFRLCKAFCWTFLVLGVAFVSLGVGRPVSVAVVDEGGHLFAFSRTADAELYSIQIAIAKARGAALTRCAAGSLTTTRPARQAM